MIEPERFLTAVNLLVGSVPPAAWLLLLALRRPSFWGESELVMGSSACITVPAVVGVW